MLEAKTKQNALLKNKDLQNAMLKLKISKFEMLKMNTKWNVIFTLKVPPIICSRRQFQILLLFKK